MPTKPTPQKTLKQEKIWYIDQDGSPVYYDSADDVSSEWWKRLGNDYGATSQQVQGQSGDFNRSSTGTGVLMQWLDHHSQAFNDSNRKHPQRKNKDD